MSAQELIARARELDAAATTGPWQTRFLYRALTVVRRFADPFGILFMADSRQDWADAEFCAETRTLLPALVEIADGQDRQIVALRAELAARDGQLARSEAERQKLADERANVVEMVRIWAEGEPEGQLSSFMVLNNISLLLTGKERT